MKLKFSFSTVFISFLLTFFLFSTTVSANEVLDKPVIPKENLVTMFDEKKEYNHNELIVKFKEYVTAAEKQGILSSVEGTEVSSVLDGKISLVSLPKGSELLTAANQLLKQETIEFVQPNYEITQAYVPSDSGYKKQWHLKKIQMQKAWDATKGSSGIIVAVIDGGVQTNHPDLKGKIVSPYNVVTGKKTFSASEHGTHVAGVVAASINKKGVVGIAPNVKIMPINVFQSSGADTYDVIDAIVYATKNGANIINMSLGNYYYDYALDDATTYAKNKGVTIIAAAGNDNTYYDIYPASLPSVISVSATNSSDKITGFSNFGYNIDLAAPGEDIYSTVSGSSYKYMDGTSMAAPVVSGVAALVLSKNPLLSPDQVENILTKSAVDLGSKGWDYYYGYGRVDASKALKQTPTPLTNISSAAAFTASGTNKNRMSFTAQKGKTVSFYIQNSKGTTIKKLVKPEKWTGGKLTASWDGKQENGLYAPTGSYNVIAKLTNGRESVYKKKTVKLTNKVKPSIKISSSALYSPTVQSKLKLYFDVNQKTAITAKIYNSKNTVIKTIFSNKSITAKTNKIEWNGTNSKEEKVKDGTYKLVLSGVGANKIKASNVNVSIKIDATKPAAQIDLLATPFKSDGASKNAVKVTFKEKVTATTYVTTDKGVKVKRLTNKQTFNSGAVTLQWNGKNDSGKFVSEGSYMYQTEAKDAAGNQMVTKSKVFSLQDWQKPIVSSTKDLTFKKEGNASFSYNISKPASVTIQLLNNGQVVRTVETGNSKNTGTNIFVWDGKDQAGNILPDGKYQFNITAVDKYKNTNSYIGNMTVSLTAVDIMYPSVSNFFEYGAGSDIYYKLSQDSSVTIEIFDSSNTKIRTIEKASRKAGINHFNWDGYDDEGYYEYWDYEVYYYVIKAKNAFGNETTVKGKITNEESPAWLTAHSYSFTPSVDYYWENTQLNLLIDVKEPTKMTLYVYDGYYSDYIVDKETYNLDEGKNERTYTKKSAEDLYYVIQYEDQLGNAYRFGIDESGYYNSYSMQKTELIPKIAMPK
ncbi:S8 family serine peptidase [Planococcus shixiaomingii]|uniref:S8 family serine peptidase n=1 Tax=Planococcus shixiaomingii TaxID=3058393 RepID=UPI002638D64E|nr:S8 family serine peptidase [Planococcus sp. N022]WKA53938.1 S8 family serine peptidase [Planococcus sp. N022]